MTVLVPIGDFSRMTHLSVKALRFYHDQGLLEPARIDPSSGYRFYDTGQVPVAQVIRRFRDLDMPLDQVRAVLTAPDVETRTKEIIAHLTAMESKLAELQVSVSSLRALLETPAVRPEVEFRSIPATRADGCRRRYRETTLCPVSASSRQRKTPPRRGCSGGTNELEGP
jgi:DNA-binding transcriptional MerR regulator